MKWKIPCVTSSWVMDSIEAGYSLPTDSYRVEVRQDEVSMCDTVIIPDESLGTRRLEDTINSPAMFGKI